MTTSTGARGRKAKKWYIGYRFWQIDPKIRPIVVEWMSKLRKRQP